MKGKWKKTSLGDLAFFIRGVSYKPYQLLHGYESNATALLRATNIQKNHLSLNDLQFVPKEIVSEKQFCKKNDILMCMSNGSRDLVGKNAQFIFKPNNFTCGAFCSVVRCKKEKLSNFIYQIVNSYDFKKQLDITLSGSAINNLQNTQLELFYFSLPESSLDRIYIADILTSCDKVIEQTEKAIAKYRDIKAGMLQDLFTRGLDANGKLRPKPENAPELYKDSPLGKIPKEWNVKKIGEMFEFKNGLNKGKEFFGYGVPIVNYMDVYKHERITPDMLHGRVCLTSQEIQNFTVCSGDVFFTRTSETPEEVGFASVIEGLCHDIVFSGFVLRARPTTDDLLDCYKQYCFRISSLRKEIVADCTYTTRALTNGTKLSEYCIAIPTHKEQQEISNRLNSIDAQIEAEEKTLEKYRSIKLGLMKKLLTPPEGALEA